jgi:hypothetical protein
MGLMRTFFYLIWWLFSGCALVVGVFAWIVFLARCECVPDVPLIDRAATALGVFAGIALFMMAGFLFERVWPDKADQASEERIDRFERWCEERGHDLAVLRAEDISSLENEFDRESQHASGFRKH